MLAVVMLVLGAIALWFAAALIKDFRLHHGDFSDWIVSDATPLNSRLWRANAWIQMVGSLVLGSLLCGAGIWQMIK